MNREQAIKVVGQNWTMHKRYPRLARAALERGYCTAIGMTPLWGYAW
jgi:hypothetical protein